MRPFQGFLIEKDGTAKEFKYENLSKLQKNNEILWLHFDYTTKEAKEWIRKYSNIDSVAVEALLTDETRPRTIVLNDALLIALRGVNLEPNSKPEKMISIRIFISSSLIISTSRKDILSVTEISENLRRGNGIKSSSEFLVELTYRMIDRMDSVIDKIEERADFLEENILEDEHKGGFRAEILKIRRESIILKRYLAPQKEALIKLYNEKLTWIDEYQKIELRETTDQLIRHIEELDTIRDKVILFQEELVNSLTEQMNKKMYILAILSAIFLPLTFLTGLLGINVGGIPGANHENAFFIFLGILGLVVISQFIFFKRKNWI
ncbi:zinc transporter ZntB [Aliarcobacter trophiarum LMG 25534]|uniref:Zinc transporter (EcCorA_ZntB-like family) n=1 Tax=Aliarcobacter trophiarum LMG 25534 TaxID=1032241 RepID=A0AAD0QM53_9BACT|nr:zinc transporter ZntB [Aliarcobacter trophiarum]AXK49718.1 zinc transporter (EcCorA_ZntB-like family) [Aliarcobacter trophiarum LMG 25534]RXI28042.1 zinc transporter ZntB [Aliarcobacter trophiarum]RXJ92504.1 zinc transporter ZntB [Aliarcobacter trophiarum LMG 25534]